MQAPSGQMPAPALQALLKDGALAGEWVLDPRTSSIRLKNRSMGGLVPGRCPSRPRRPSGATARPRSTPR
jgi:hypothetical protein